MIWNLRLPTWPSRQIKANHISAEESAKAIWWPHREGRRLYVAQDEAARWARENGLTFVPTIPNSAPTEDVRDRAARVTVLVWQGKGKTPVNLFTHIRHRRRDSLGPWAGDPDGIWSSEIVVIDDMPEPAEIRLYRLDASLEYCQGLVDGILVQGTLEIDGVGIDYSLEYGARRFWAFRDIRGSSDAEVLSPFDSHSAEIIESWSFDDDLQRRWQELVVSPPAKVQALLEKLKFPLDRRPERVGNLMIASAQDEIGCDLWLHRDNVLVLKVDMANEAELPVGAYTASVWANHAGDYVLRRSIDIAANETLFEIASDVDWLGVAVHRNSDGQCIHLEEVHLVKEVHFAMHLNAGPTITMHDPRRSSTNKISLGNSRSTFSVNADEYTDARDRTIRQMVLGRRVWESEVEARRARNLARFRPGQLDKAIDYFLDLLRRYTDSDEPIYLVDPYFINRGPDGSTDRLYLGMFEITTGRPLRILCEPHNIGAWWSNYPPTLISHATVRSFAKTGTPLLHDRYLITPEREIQISHSINGWDSGGVTFTSLPYGVYRAEAEALWSISIGTHSDGTQVCEVK